MKLLNTILCIFFTTQAAQAMDQPAALCATGVIASGLLTYSLCKPSQFLKNLCKKAYQNNCVEICTLKKQIDKLEELTVRELRKRIPKKSLLLYEMDDYFNHDKAQECYTGTLSYLWFKACKENPSFFEALKIMPQKDLIHSLKIQLAQTTREYKRECAKNKEQGKKSAKPIMHNLKDFGKGYTSVLPKLINLSSIKEQ